MHGRLSAAVSNLSDKRRYTVSIYSGVMSSTDYYGLRPRGLMLKAVVML